MMSNAGRLLVLCGVALLLHAGYSIVQHRSFLKLAEEDYNGLPNDIAVECVLAVALCFGGVVTATGGFIDIRLTSELNTKSYETVGNRAGFFTFSHRGRAVYDAMR